MKTQGRKGAKAATRARILRVASRLVRRRGLAAASVPRVMRGAGLTVGGFYGHFASKRAMDAEVLRATLAETRATWLEAIGDRTGPAWLRRAVRTYLSREHRDQGAAGCPLPAVLSELTWADAATRDVVTAAIEAEVAAITAHAPVAPGVTERERALATIALCVGGLALARVLRGPASDEMLAACARWALPESAA